MSEKEFVSGLIPKQPHPNAPDYVKLNISIKREDLIIWLSGRTGEWINVDINESKQGKLYAVVNDYKKASSANSPNDPELAPF